MKYVSFIIITFVFSTCTSGQRDGRQLTQPEEALVSIRDLCIEQFDTEKAKTLKRYLTGNPRWEVLRENGKSYAIRKEMPDGKYQPSFNGF